MKPVSIRSVRIEFWFATLLLSALFLTNRYLSLPADTRWVDFAGGDSFSYLTIARAFPSLPTDGVISAHAAQRFFLPWVMGGAAWLTRHC